MKKLSRNIDEDTKNSFSEKTEVNWIEFFSRCDGFKQTQIDERFKFCECGVAFSTVVDRDTCLRCRDGKFPRELTPEYEIAKTA